MSSALLKQVIVTLYGTLCELADRSPVTVLRGLRMRQAAVKTTNLSLDRIVSGVPRERRSDWGRRQVAYIAADAHLLVPKLRTLSPHDSAATACRNDGWNALERVRLLDLARRV